MVTAVLVLIAGGTTDLAVRLAVAMTAFQFAIGTVNDLVDEPLDRGAKTGKPLPRGLLARREAWTLASALVAAGVILTLPAGLGALAVALAGLATGLAYDLRLKGTVWSWLPFAVGVPLLPVYAWVGATGRLPSAFLVLLPAAVAAGAGLAVANLLADVERDTAAGVATLATRLGRARAWWLGAALLTGVVTVAVATVFATRGGGAGSLGVAGGVGAIGLGLLAGRSERPVRRERAWELEAAGVGLLAAGWLAALAEAGAL